MRGKEKSQQRAECYKVILRKRYSDREDSEKVEKEARIEDKLAKIMEGESPQVIQSIFLYPGQKRFLKKL